MARMFPDDGPANDLRGESKIYYLLSKLEDDYYIFQDRHWIFKGKNGSRTEREIDFLLVHPRKGLLIIEVKGGSEFKYDGINDKWKSGNDITYDNPYKKQLANSKLLPLYLKENIPSLKNKWLLCGYAICFPEIDVLEGNLSPFMEKEVSLFKHDLNNLNSKIDEIYRHYSTPNQRPLGFKIVEEIKNLITPKSEFKKSLSLKLEEQTENIIRLTREQQEIIDSFYREHRPILIEGPAGTGKTQIAISQAISDINLDKFVLFITNSQQSKYYINQEISLNVNFSQENLIILNMSKEIDLIQSISILEKIDMEEIRIIIDEAQQLDGKFLRNLFDYIDNKSNISIIMFKDDSQKTNENAIQELFHPFTFTLQKIIRNTEQIFESYQDYISPSYKIKKPVRKFKEVSHKYFTNDNEIINLLISTIDNLTNKEKVLPKNITILFSNLPNDNIIKSLAKLINDHKLLLKEFSLASPIDGKTITWSTSYKFQGLENHIILLVELTPEPISETITLRRSRYIGRSRACSILHIFLKQDSSLDDLKIADLF